MKNVNQNEMIHFIKNLSEKLMAASQSEPGWLDGSGKATTMIAIETAGSLIVSMKDSMPGFKLPFIYPKENGGLSLEWPTFEYKVSPTGEVTVVWI